MGILFFVKERIQKVLAAAGVASRRNVEQMVLDGRIAINGRVVRHLPLMVDPENDRIAVDQEVVKSRRSEPTRLVYLLMNKPKGVYSTNVAQGEQLRVIDLLPPGFPHRVFPVGRLDADSRGLLLLTNDGELTNQLTHPKYGVVKTYRATVDGTIDPEATRELEEGVWLADPHKGGFRTSRSRIKVIKRGRERSVLEITIKEGRNRQIRRMLARIGHKVRDLVRVKMGPIELENLKPGSMRQLTSREVKSLRAAANKRIDESASSEPSSKAVETPVGKSDSRRPVRRSSETEKRKPFRVDARS